MTTKSEIVVHATDTRPDWMEASGGQAKVDEVTLWHVRDRGWNDNGYNELIDRDGKVYGGRDLDNDGDFAEETGAHVKGYNKQSIGIALIGGYGGSADDQFSDHFTPAQDKALRERIEFHEQRFGPLVVKGHNQYANKACPCFNVQTWMARKAPKPARTNVTQSSSVRTAVTGLATNGGGAVMAVRGLEGHNQTIALVFMGLAALMFLYLMKERIRHWGEGLR